MRKIKLILLVGLLLLAGCRFVAIEAPVNSVVTVGAEDAILFQDLYTGVYSDDFESCEAGSMNYFEVLYDERTTSTYFVNTYTLVYENTDCTGSYVQTNLQEHAYEGIELGREIVDDYIVVSFQCTTGCDSTYYDIKVAGFAYDRDLDSLDKTNMFLNLDTDTASYVGDLSEGL